ncbi:elongation of very long chain fatty acids protein 7-like [Oppia nitens]|uniref:elongation of very long chain fatty acids protein 7-like n=1 Tax=Oppia nitens TaxID=1686743 RepID=UPI0023DBF2BD|nr:elongation of very long chain fatty acids protein 7-like [Oppia nitens]
MSTPYRVSDSTSSTRVSGGIRYYLQHYWQDTGDQRTVGLPLIREGPWAMLFVMTLYLLFVTKLGPRMMKHREPYQLRGPMFIYNTLMVVINYYFFFQAFRWLDYGRELANFRWPDGSDNSQRTMDYIWSFYLYWLTKFVDLLDTVFFVLRKKYRQITALHLYHHTVVPILGWLYLWYCWGSPAITLFALLNSAVHVIMYSYYALAAFGPSIQKFLWWKRYITQIQLIQFALLCMYGCFIYKYQHGYPQFAFWLAATQPPLFLILFAQFYLQCYTRVKKVD